MPLATVARQRDAVAVGGQAENNRQRRQLAREVTFVVALKLVDGPLARLAPQRTGRKAIVGERVGHGRLGDCYF